jgi:hypothetical protein
LSVRSSFCPRCLVLLEGLSSTSLQSVADAEAKTQ